MGVINEGISDNDDLVDSPDPTDTIYVRNEGIIDSPYEFTYFLYDQEKPWRTFQFFEENDPDDETRSLVEHLAPRIPSSNRRGWINPNSLNSNVLASAFYDMPVDEFVQKEFSTETRLTREQSYELADLFMENRLYNSQKEVADNISSKADYLRIDSIVEGNPWQKESLLRNGLGLFNLRDSTFTILLAAQSGKDTNSDSIISDDEVQSTQKAVAYVWRDPETGKAACVFWGLSDTLKNSGNWGSILSAFKPSP